MTKEKNLNHRSLDIYRKHRTDPCQTSEDVVQLQWPTSGWKSTEESERNLPSDQSRRRTLTVWRIPRVDNL